MKTTQKIPTNLGRFLKMTEKADFFWKKNWVGHFPDPTPPPWLGMTGAPPFNSQVILQALKDGPRRSASFSARIYSKQRDFSHRGRCEILKGGSWWIWYNIWVFP